MPGKVGMKRTSGSNVIRRHIWRSIRIMRRFSQPDILRTVPGATPANVKKYLSWLVKHGYVTKDSSFTGGRAGDFQRYCLNRNPGPEHPTRCDLCGEPITSLKCIKEKEKEREREKEKETEVTHDAA
jgi:hypothetical protein